jgi:hypothetical protein
MNDETKHRERVLNYKVPYESTLVGKGTILTCEKQVRNKKDISELKTKVFQFSLKYNRRR